MSDDRKIKAIKSELDNAMAATTPPPATQGELFNFVPTRFEAGTAEHDEMVQRLRTYRGGRPPGAPNLATRETLAFIRQIFGDPMMESARWLLHSPETLATELGCSKLVAFDRLEKVRADLRLYLYPRLAPVAADGTAVVPSFNMQVVAGAGLDVAAASGLPPWELRRLGEKQAVLATLNPRATDPERA